MMSDVVIKAEGVSKKFCLNLKRSLLYGTHDIFRNMVGVAYDTGTLRKDEFWALDDINFELKRGETLGIIGVNGSGKSTLLRLLSGIFPSDKGRITVKGRIGSLIAVGAGFHPHMTGRENIFLNGTILGMTKKEILQKFDSIVDFAEIGEFLEAPVSTYSSGMRVRLGFAIAVHCEPEILLIDEVLSVGDLSFRNKSLRHMADFRKKAKALIFISHQLEQVRVLCTRVIILDKGKIIYDGPAHEGCVAYEELTREIRLQNANEEISAKKRLISTLGDYKDEAVEIENLGIVSERGEAINEVGLNDSLIVFCDLSISKPIKQLFFALEIVDEQRSTHIIRIVSNDENRYFFSNLGNGQYRIITKIIKHYLMPGIYIPHIAIKNGDTFETYGRATIEAAFKVYSDSHKLERGIVNIEYECSLSKR
ncbi:MAG: ATP-binding cassette domain-containing protein [Nitrospirae bacterium]|nr:ATP-binding cassette domain-containing protein [Nitrospirota bacterium]